MVQSVPLALTQNFFFQFLDAVQSVSLFQGSDHRRKANLNQVSSVPNESCAHVLPLLQYSEAHLKVQMAPARYEDMHSHLKNLADQDSHTALSQSSRKHFLSQCLLLLLILQWQHQDSFSFLQDLSQAQYMQLSLIHI